MNKKRKKRFTKVKSQEVERLERLESPDFILKISIITYDDLKKWNLIDSKTFREKQKRKIKKDFEGGDLDE